MPSEIVAELVESRYIVAEIQERPSQGVQALIDKIYLYNPDAANKLIEELNKFIETLGNYGSYNSLTDKPVLNTTSTTSLAAVADEIIRDTIKLHKISKTGSYSDLLSKPLFGSLAFKNTIYNSDVADGAGITKNKLSAAVQATLDKADASVGAIEAEAQARQEADEQLQSNIEAEATTRENEDIKLKAQIDANAAAIQKTREDYAAADEALQEQITSSAGDISTLRTDLDDLGEQVSVIESKIPESASDTNQLVTSSQLTAESQDIRSEFAQADSELQQQINAHATAITGLEDDVEAIESKIPTTASQENLLATTSQLNDAIQDVRTDFASADTELQTQITGQAAVISSIQDDVTDIESKISTLASSNNKLISQSELSDVEQDIRSDMNESDSELQTQITSQAEAIATLQTDLGDLGDQVVDNHNDISNHIADKDNPHEVTKAQVGLGNVDNTSDMDKPVSTAMQEALDLKADQSTTYTKTESDENLTNALTDYVKRTDYASSTKGGVVKLESYYGVGTSPSGSFWGVPTTLTDYKNSRDARVIVCKGTLENIKYDLVKRAVTENDITLTDDEKTAARTWIGAISDTYYAGTNGSPGTIRTSAAYGTQMVTSGYLRAGSDSLESYQTRGVNFFVGKGTLENIKDDLVKRGVTENTITLTDNEKSAARTWIGASSQSDLGSVESNISDIESKIPSAASATNLLADRDFVNSSINNLASFYLTSNAAGDAFATKAALVAGPYYFQGVLRTATLNDYAIVIADETKNNASTRYMYDGTQWDFQYVINDTPFTQDQVNAINSTVTQEKVESYSAHIINKSNPHNVTKAQVGLGNVDNTSDANKPISTATKEALDTISGDLSDHIADTDNPHEVTKSQIGLGNVDNTSDADKPISTATQDAIDEVSGTLTEHIENTENPHGVTKAQVGLGNVNNTSDLNKPISTATQAALDLKANTASVYTKAQTYSQTEIDTKLEAKLDVSAASSTYATIANLNSHVNNKSNPHGVTKTQVGLGNVDNTSDLNKPVSTAQQNAINTAKQNVIDQYMEADTALQTQITAHADELTSINEDIVDINEKIPVGASSTNLLVSTSQLEDRAQSIISGYEEADSELQTQINGQASSITSLTGRVSTNESTIAMLDSDVDSLMTDVATAKSDISGLKTATNTQAGLIQDLQSGKQNTLTQAQLNAVNSGITAAKVSTYDNYATEIAGKQPAGDYATNTALSQGLNGKVDKDQGVAYAGKVLAVNEQGVVEPTEVKTGGVNATYDATNHRITFA